MTRAHHRSPIPSPELENVDPLTVGAFHAFGKTLHLHRQAMLRMMLQRGIQPGEVFCLALLNGNDGISQRDLAAILHLSRPRVTKMLQALEKAGAIVRRADEVDQRLTRVYLTPEGRRKERAHRSILEDYVNETFGTLSEAERREFERLLTELADRISDIVQAENEASE